MLHRLGLLLLRVAEDEENSVMGVLGLAVRCLRTCSMLANFGGLLSVLACAPPASAGWDKSVGADSTATAAAIALRLLCNGPSMGLGFTAGSGVSK